MARRMLKVVGIPVVVLAAIVAMFLVAQANADSDIGYAVLKLIAGESGTVPLGAAPLGVAAGQGMSGQSCGGSEGGSCSTESGGSCSTGADASEHSCDKCASTHVEEEANPEGTSARTPATADGMLGEAVGGSTVED
jgi:hypothetical protein